MLATFFVGNIFRRKTTIKELLINEQIIEKEVRLISDQGEQLGIVSRSEALRLADEQGLDLVKISPNSNPPVCKLMDYGKYKFELGKKEKEQRKNQKVVELKEVQLSFTIAKHDMETKCKAAQKFLQEGNKVKVTIRMFGRQQANPQFGIEVMHNFVEMLGDSCTIEKDAEVIGRNILLIIVPKKIK